MSKNILKSDNFADNALIQKSKPLLSLANSSISLAEFKILDLFMARINSHDPDNRTVRFEKGVLESALGVDRIKKDDLNRRLDNLFAVVNIEDSRKKEGFKKVNLFEVAECELGDDGLWIVNLTCSQSAKEYFFNVESLGYLRYRLRNIIHLQSRYSYVLYLYVLDNRFQKKWQIDFEDLKRLLNCTAPRYEQFKFFNSEILKKCHSEIMEKTDISFDYTPIRIGSGTRSRAVKSIEFNYLSAVDLLEEAANSPCAPADDDGSEGKTRLPLFHNDNGVPIGMDEEFYDVYYESKDMSLLASACKYEFNPGQMEQIFSALVRTGITPDKVFDDNSAEGRHDALLWGRHRYLSYKYADFCSQSEMNKKRGKMIINRFAYFLKSLENNANEKLTD